MQKIKSVGLFVDQQHLLYTYLQILLSVFISMNGKFTKLKFHTHVGIPNFLTHFCAIQAVSHAYNSGIDHSGSEPSII